MTKLVGTRTDLEKMKRLEAERWERTTYRDVYRCKVHGTEFAPYVEDPESCEPCWPCYDECQIPLTRAEQGFLGK